MVVHASNLSTLETEVGGSGVQSYPGLHSKTLSKKCILFIRSKLA